jgi:nucleoside-diphosphate-sugar epimerase
MSKVTVLGAAGGLGHAITDELLARGHDVTAVTRSGPGSAPGVTALTADLLDIEQAVLACSGADVVVMAAQVGYREWVATLPRLVEHAMVGAAAADARLVMVDNLYAYGAPEGPITEHTPEAATTRKGALRRSLGQQLLAAHTGGRVAVSIGRLSDYYGPGGTNSMVHILGIGRALEGKAPKAMIDPDQPHTFVYLPDAARGFAALVEHPEADGRVWILPAAPAVTQRELLTMVAREAGLEPRIGRIGPAMLRLGGLFDANVRELRELVEQWDRPYVTDASAFLAEFGALQVTPHEQAVADTVAAFRG